MIQVRSEMCPQDHRCPTLSVCPTGALTQEGVAVPEVDEEACIDCGACARTCPVFAQAESKAPGA
ncbi:MAG: 4Fe-4S binding protein [Myxococcales bacterium]|jgi:ferredoxin